MKMGAARRIFLILAYSIFILHPSSFILFSASYYWTIIENGHTNQVSALDLLNGVSSLTISTNTAAGGLGHIGHLTLSVSGGNVTNQIGTNLFSTVGFNLQPGSNLTLRSSAGILYLDGSAASDSVLSNYVLSSFTSLTSFDNGTNALWSALTNWSAGQGYAFSTSISNALFQTRFENQALTNSAFSSLWSAQTVSNLSYALSTSISNALWQTRFNDQASTNSGFQATLTAQAVSNLTYLTAATITNSVSGTTTITGATNTINFGVTFSNAPTVLLSWAQSTLGEIATLNLLSVTTSSASFEARNGAGVMTNAYAVNYAAFSASSAAPSLAALPFAVSVTFSTNIVVDASASRMFFFTATNNFTLASATNAVAGQPVTYRIRQDTTGSRLITFSSAYRFGNGITSIILTTNANATDYIGCLWNSIDSKWDVSSTIGGFLP